MIGLAILGALIGALSLGGAAYLLRVWHEDAADLRARGYHVGWRTLTLSRVLAYLAIACMIASNYLAALTILRLLDINILGLSNAQLRDALAPFTLVALLVLDSAFAILALYLRAVRRR